MKKIMVAIGVGLAVLAVNAFINNVDPDKNLKRGDTGASVAELQRQINLKLDKMGLIASGFKISVMGVFDDVTVQALNILFPEPQYLGVSPPWRLFGVISINEVKAL